MPPFYFLISSVTDAHSSAQQLTFHNIHIVMHHLFFFPTGQEVGGFISVGQSGTLDRGKYLPKVTQEIGSSGGI